MRRVWWSLLLAVGVGCAGPRATLRFHEEVPGNLPEQRLRRITAPLSGEELTISPYPSLSERDVDQAWVAAGTEGTAVVVQFDAHGVSKLAELTMRMRGQQIAVLVNDRVVAVNRVERAVMDGKYTILGDLSDAAAGELVESLNKLAGRRRSIGDARLRP